MLIEDHLLAAEARIDALELRCAAMAYEAEGMRIALLAILQTLGSGAPITRADGATVRVMVEPVEPGAVA